MIARKTLRVPVHYATTSSKLHKLDNITARLTYGIRIISEHVTEDTKLDRNALHIISTLSEVAEKTGLSSGFVQQCEDRALWSWKSYKALHADWERKLAYNQEKLLTLEDEKKKTGKEQYI